MARLFVHEVRSQQLLFWRTYEAAFFTFLLPIIFLVMLGAVYGDAEIDGIHGATFLLAGMIGYGIASSAFAGLGITLVIRRESGVLKRVRGTPIPPIVHLSGVITSMIIVIAINVIVQLLIGHYAFDAAWPAAPVSFALELLLGAATFATLGVAITGLVRSAEGSSAIVNAIYLPMTFLSGAFFSTESLPAFLQAIAEVLPLTYLLRMLRDSFVEGDSIADQGANVAVLLAWAAVAVVFALRRFRWEPREA